MERLSAAKPFLWAGNTAAGLMQVMQGQMYAEVLTPERVMQPYPLVMIHGMGQTACTWLGQRNAIKNR
jgi:hypothetical protein